MNYKDMGLSDKMLMNVLKLVLKTKKNKDKIEIGTMEAINNSYDNSSRKAIEPLLDYLRTI
jgi:hypothetical protein